MNDEQSPPNSFREMVRWDGCLPLIVIGSRLVLAIWIGMQDAAIVAALLVTPVVAIVRTVYANRQMKRLGLKPGYARRICLVAAIITLMICEFYVLLFQADPTGVPLFVWLLPAGIYMVYLMLITVALRPGSRIEPIDSYADYWTSRPIEK